MVEWQTIIKSFQIVRETTFLLFIKKWSKLKLLNVLKGKTFRWEIEDENEIVILRSNEKFR